MSRHRHRSDGICSELMKEARMSVAMVATGGDPGHAPARRTYENSVSGNYRCTTTRSSSTDVSLKVYFVLAN